MQKPVKPKNLLLPITSARYLHKYLLAFMVLICVLFTCYPVGNYDIWWHLKTGETIVKTAQIPTTDIFSFTKFGGRWVSHEWLSEVLLYLIKIPLGINGLIFFKTLIIGVILFLLYRLCLLSTHRKFLVLSLIPIFLFLSRLRFFVRPHLFTMLFFSVTYLILELNLQKKIQKKIPLIFLPALFLVWANCHGGFLYGLLLVYLYLLIAIIGYLRHKKSKPLLMIIISVICTLICLINPNGIDVFLYPLTIIKAGYVGTNREWSSPFAKSLTGYYATKYLIGYSSILLIILMLNFRKFSLKDILFAVLFFGLAAKSQRNIPFYAVISIPIFIKNISLILDKYLEKTKIPVLYLKYLIIIMFAVMNAYFYAKGIPIADKGRGAVKCGIGVNKLVLPVDAMKFIKTKNITGNFFNAYQFGGYLLYYGFPEIKVFIDGRADVYGEQLYHSYRKSLMVPDEFKNIESAYDFDSILLEYNPDNKPLHDYLYHSKKWILVYFDNISLIYVKNLPNNTDIISNYGYKVVNPLDNNQGKKNRSNVDDLINEYIKALVINPDIEYAYIRLANLYRQKGDFSGSLKITKKAYKKFPDHYTVLNQLGLCYRYLEDYDSAEKYFMKAIRTNPYLLDAYGNMAVLCYLQNDLIRTRKFLAKTLKINPDDPIANTILKEIGVD